MLIAHRGASGYRPEHTEAAYRLAFAQGADAVEPDLVASADGVLVLRHERELSGSTDVATRAEFAGRFRSGVIDGQPVDGWFVEDFSWAELETLRAREPNPMLRPGSASYDGQFALLRFCDLLRMLAEPTARSAAGQATRLVAELKDANYFDSIGLNLAELTRADLVAAGWEPDDPRLVFESFEPEPLDRLAGWGRRVLLVDAPPLSAQQHAESERELRLAQIRELEQLAHEFDGLSVPVETLLIDPELPHRIGERGKLRYAYTLRPESPWVPAEYRARPAGAADSLPAERPDDWMGWFTRVLSAGFDGVFVDHPDLARAALSN